MKIENKMPYIQFHTNDWLNYTRNFSFITKGVFMDLLSNTWNRKCVWIKLDEAKEMALNNLQPMWGDENRSKSNKYEK